MSVQDHAVIEMLHAEQELQSFSRQLDSYAKKKGLGGEDVAELRAILMMTGRSLDRRIKGGVVSAAKIRDELEDALYAQIVQREGLMTAEDWAEIAQGSPEAAPAQSPAEIMLKLKQMYPQVQCVSKHSV